MAGMTGDPVDERRLHHRLRPMTGRDPGESHRAATPLELLLDLSFVVAFSQAGEQAAQQLAAGHAEAAWLGFGFALFAICWAWVNFTWLSSAYDNDDVVFRVATMVVVVGVLIMALGLPAIFDSIAAGAQLDNTVATIGYVVMRLATISLWLRAAHDDPAHRRVSLRYAIGVGAVQLVWITLLFVHVPLAVTMTVVPFLYLGEMLVPVIAERVDGGSPWHAHHVAERYSLLVIITIGEVVLGTTLAVSAVVQQQGWSVEAVLLAIAGVALAFGVWWVYFVVPAGLLLERHRERAFAWGYGHIILFGSVAAIGAGLHLAAAVLSGEAVVGPLVAMLTVAIPVAVFVVAVFGLYAQLLRVFDPLHLWLLVAVLAVLALAVVIVVLGASLGTGLLVVALAPVVVVVGYETVGYRHEAAALRRELAPVDETAG